MPQPSSSAASTASDHSAVLVSGPPESSQSQHHNEPQEKKAKLADDVKRLAEIKRKIVSDVNEIHNLSECKIRINDDHVKLSATVGEKLSASVQCLLCNTSAGVKEIKLSSTIYSVDALNYKKHHKRMHTVKESTLEAGATVGKVKKANPSVIQHFKPQPKSGTSQVDLAEVLSDENESTEIDLTHDTSN